MVITTEMVLQAQQKIKSGKAGRPEENIVPNVIKALPYEVLGGLATLLPG